jgi:hypothetical protein
LVLRDSAVPVLFVRSIPPHEASPRSTR